MKIDELESDVKKSQRFVILAAITPALIYLLWFCAANNQNLSLDSADWGVFGDFVGGLINPLIAFFAFYWLTRSVLIQKIELSETRSALVETQRAQEEQAKIALRAAKLQSLSIRLNAVNHRVSLERDFLAYVLSEAQRNGEQYTVMLRDGSRKKPSQIIPGISQEIERLSKEQDDLIKQVEALADNA